MKIGISKTNISPEKSIELAGYGFYLNRFSDGIKHNLCAKSFIFSIQSKLIALITLDLLGLNRDTTSKIRKKIVVQTNIPEKNILLSSVHTHSGPASVYLRGVGGFDKNYVNSIIDKVVKSAVTAFESMSECKAGFGKVKAPKICYNRSKNNYDIKNYIDFLKITDNKDKIISVLLFYGCHSVVLRDDNTKITPDFSFYTCKKLEDKLGIETAGFFQGSSGDIDPITKNNDFEEAKTIGEKLANPIIKEIYKINTYEFCTIGILTKYVKLPTNNLSFSDLENIKKEIKRNQKAKFLDLQYPNSLRVEREWTEQMLKKLKTEKIDDYIEAEFQFIKLNDRILVGIPAEMFYSIENKIKKNLDDNSYIFVGYTNDFLGYFPDYEDFKNKGYASMMTPIFLDNFHFKPQIEDIITENIIKGIKELK